MTRDFIILVRPIVVDKNIPIAVPALEAFKDSKYWRPVIVKDGVIYVWREGEGIYDPQSHHLYYITRSSGRIVLIPGVHGIPGGYLSNVLQEPSEEDLKLSCCDRDIVIAMILFSKIIKNAEVEMPCADCICADCCNDREVDFLIRGETSYGRTAHSITVTVDRIYGFPVFVLSVPGSIGAKERELLKNSLPSYIFRRLEAQLEEQSSQ